MLLTYDSARVPCCRCIPSQTSGLMPSWPNSLLAKQHCAAPHCVVCCLGQVHFDCLYKGLDVASSRAARLLGGNRTVSEVCHYQSRLHHPIQVFQLAGSGSQQAPCGWAKSILLVPDLCLWSQPLEFVAGNSLFASDTKEDVGERAGGLYAGASGPKPPPVLGSAVVGMRKGGKVPLSCDWLQRLSPCAAVADADIGAAPHWCSTNVMLSHNC